MSSAEEVRAQCIAWIQALPRGLASLRAADMGGVVPPDVETAVDLAIELGLHPANPAARPLVVGYRAGLAAAAARIQAGEPR